MITPTFGFILVLIGLALCGLFVWLDPRSGVISEMFGWLIAMVMSVGLLIIFLAEVASETTA